MKNLFVFLLFSISLSACSSNVKPWERGNLARDEMTFGTDGLISTINDHIYFSKEATSGGSSFAAGGCGCN